MKPIFSANPSPVDYRTITTKSVGELPAESFKIPLDYLPVNDLCSQHKLGICTMCTVRMMSEQYIKDGVRLSEYWGYLMGKMFVDGNLTEGSAIMSMLKCANKFGIPTKDMETIYPLKIDGTYQEFIESFQSTYNGNIPQKVMDNAAAHKIPGYASVPTTPLAIATALSTGSLLGIRLTVGENTYTRTDGQISWLAKDLLPLRAPKNIDGGHALVHNEYNGLTEEQMNYGPNSWGKEWCSDNPLGPGYYSFVFSTQKPYLTEAWQIVKPVPKVKEVIKVLPAVDINLQKIAIIKALLVAYKKLAELMYGIKYE